MEARFRPWTKKKKMVGRYIEHDNSKSPSPAFKWQADTDKLHNTAFINEGESSATMSMILRSLSVKYGSVY